MLSGEARDGGSRQLSSGDYFDPWESPVVFAFDGGGMRGLSSLLILKAIFIKVAELDNDRRHDEVNGVAIARPCHYVDFMVGPSTGGLVSILLSRLRLSIQEAIDDYVEFGGKIFGSPRSIPQRVLRYNNNKYSADNFETQLKKTLRKHGLDDDELMRQDYHTDEVQHRCMTVALAVKKIEGGHVTWPFRSYDHTPTADPRLIEEIEPGPADSLHPTRFIWRVARATTAAPGYFEYMKIDDQTYMDGGILHNNPAMFAWLNAKEVTRTRNHEVAILISFGTGRRRERSIFDNRGVPGLHYGVLKRMKFEMLDTEKTHKEILRNLHPRDDGQKPYYCRLNVGQGLESVKLDHWQKQKFPRWRFDAKLSESCSPGRGTDMEGVPFLLNAEGRGDQNRVNGRLSDGSICLTLAKIEQATRNFLGRIPANKPKEFNVKDAIQECAERLVAKAKERRNADMDRWNFFIGEVNVERRTTAQKNYEPEAARPTRQNTTTTDPGESMRAETNRHTRNAVNHPLTRSSENGEAGAGSAIEGIKSPASQAVSRDDKAAPAG